MWKGHERALWLYVRIMCVEWVVRGYRDSIAEQLEQMQLPNSSSILLPKHFTNSFFRSHQSNLVRKDPEHLPKVLPDRPRQPAVCMACEEQMTKEREELIKWVRELATRAQDFAREFRACALEDTRIGSDNYEPVCQ